MLICKKCSAECSDTAKFCHICGERIDGKKHCDACGAWNEQDAVFCPTCGARVDGKNTCVSCGTVFEGNFCPECGTAVKKAKTVVCKTEKSQKVSGKVKSISELVSSGLIALGALFALIFVFFIGMEPSVLGSSLSGLGLPSGDTKLNLYYFFGQVYEELEAYKPTGRLGSSERWFQQAVYLRFQEYAVVGTIVSALILLVVAGTAITALTICVLNWLKITKKSSYGWGMAAIISFIGAVGLFANLNSLSMSILGSAEAISIVWTGATTAGFVLCAVFGGLAIIAKMMAQGSAPWRCDRILKTVLSLVGVALVCVWLGAIVGLGMQIKESSSNITIKVGSALFSFMFVSLFSAGNVQTGHMELLDPKIYTVTTLSLINQLITAVLFVCVVLMLLSKVKNLHNSRGKGGVTFIFGIVTWVLSLTLCILCPISIRSIAGCAEHLVNGSELLTSDTVKYMGYNVAFTMVMSSVYLAYEIGKKVLKALCKAKENA